MQTFDLSLRPDIQWTHVKNSTTDWWIAYDPLKTQYFRCSETEKSIYEKTSSGLPIEQLLRRLKSIPAFRKLTLNELRVVLQRGQQSRILIERKTDKTFKQVAAYNANGRGSNSFYSSIHATLSFVEALPSKLLQVQIRLFDPSRVLKTFVTNFAGPLALYYSTYAVLFWCVAFAVTFVYVGLKVLSTSNSLRDFFQVAASTTIDQGIAFVAIAFITRVLHELGHAVVATKFRSEVRSAGIWLMGALAIPFVSVTDAWRLPEKKERVAVSLAGVYTEWIIATVAAWIWMIAEPGPIQNLAAYTAILCSLVTTLVNLNPFVRFDGYYVVSDFFEIVNLRDESTRRLANLAAGGKTWRDILLASYAMISQAYRIFMAVALAWTILIVAHSIQLRFLGIIAVTMIVISWYIVPCLRKSLEWSRGDRAGGTFATVSTALLLLLFVEVSLIPLPLRHSMSGRLMARRHVNIYTQESGRIESTQPFKLQNSDLEIEIAKCREFELTSDHEASLVKSQMFSDVHAGIDVASAVLKSRNAKRRLDELQKREQMLVLSKSQQSSFKVPNGIDFMKTVPRTLPAMKNIDNTEGYLFRDHAESSQFGISEASTSNSILASTIYDPSSAGKWIDKGTHVATLVDPRLWTVACIANATTRGQIALGMNVRVSLEAIPARIFHGRIVAIEEGATIENSKSHPAIEYATRLDTQTTRLQILESTSQDYRRRAQNFGVKIEIDDSEMDINALLQECHAEIVIDLPKKCIAEQIAMFVQDVRKY